MNDGVGHSEESIESHASIEAELVECFQEFYRAYAQREEGVVDFIRERLSSEVTGFGTGRDERFTDRATMIRIFREELRQQPDPFSMDFVWTEARLLAPSIGVVDTEVVVTVPIGDGETLRFDLRLSGVLRNEDGKWRLTHNHGSMPASEQAAGERMPIDALKARNQELERLVSERTASLKATQAQLIHQEKMASLGALTAGIAHEIKNPLNFVTNFASLSSELIAELANETDQTERAAILANLKANSATIAEHASRADAVVTGMMQHARGQTGEREDVNLNALVEEYTKHARHALLARDPDAEVVIEISLGNDVGTVRVAPQEIGRVVVALLSNAFDAGHQRSEADGRPPTVMVSTARRDGYAVVRVEDNGPGIAPDAIDRVFEPFYTTKPTGQGHTGLGLSLAHDAVVQGHGGTLSVESEDRQGAVFTLTLPSS